MKSLLVLLSTFFLFIQAQAETWDSVAISATVTQGGLSVSRTILNNQFYLKAAARTYGGATTDYFIAYSEITGEIDVIRKSPKTLVLTILTPDRDHETDATNADVTKGAVVCPVDIQTSEGHLNGSIYGTFTVTQGGALKTYHRTFIGGSPDSKTAIIGTIRLTGKKYEFSRPGSAQ